VTDYRHLSLWHDLFPGVVQRRPPLPGNREVDVCIVGAGFTGLWTAYYLARLDPSLRIAVLERETAGYGASGRNGGWCSALFPVSTAALSRRSGRDAALAMHRALCATVDEVGRVAAEESIDCGFRKGGTIGLARTPVQLERARAEVAAARAGDLGDHHLEWLPADEASSRLAATDVLGATYTPHCAAIDPFRLVRGLADAVLRRGVDIYEATPVTRLSAGEAVTPYGAIRAQVIVRATEGYTAGLPGQRRAMLPVYSLMLATEPLPASFWDAVGLRRGETFNDHRHLIIYGQRTTDDRLAFGGRGAPYHLGSTVRADFDRDLRVHQALHATLVDLFPALRGAAITHRWGGPLGIARDWFPSVGLDRRTGLGWAGGYVGDGVAASNLAGRTLADLVCGHDSELVRLPWVGHRSRRWEPEPLRWLGVNVGLRVMASADDEERRTGRPSRRAAVFGRLIGH
jgi:glycine/D-amino acid oxidase-like deaminating enzyme